MTKMNESRTPKLDLRMRLKFLRDELDKAESAPYRKERKERNRAAYERLMDRIHMDVYLEDAGDR
jgi:hypothetical protein